MILAVLSGFILACLAPQIARVAKGSTGWVLAVLPASLFVYFLQYHSLIAGGETLFISYDWLPQLAINASFYLDGLSFLFALLITGLGTCIVIYAGDYLKGEAMLGRFYCYLLMFMASMLGVVLSSNIFTLFVFWELTSLSSYFLIGYFFEEEKSRRASLQALLVTGLGGLALFAGFIIMSFIGGSFELIELTGQHGTFIASGYIKPLLILIFIGTFTKSAQFPFHFWLPNAMEAPTPVSAYLHSATMVKAGVYLLARLSPLFDGHLMWNHGLMGFGLTTMVVGAFYSYQQRVLKKILAYSTVSVLGLLVFLIGVGTEGAMVAMVTFLLAHALSKGALFLVAGAIDHSTGVKDITKLSGLRKSMPIIAGAALLAAFSKVGLPPFVGFIGKELVYETGLHLYGSAKILTAILVIANMFLFAAILFVGIKPFFGKERTDYPHKPHRASLALWFGPGILSAVGLYLGLNAHLTETSFIAPTVENLIHHKLHHHLGLWHGFNTALLLSTITVIGGVLLYKFRDVVVETLESIEFLSMDELYDELLALINKVSAAVTNFFQNGSLRYYMITVLFFAALILGYHTFITSKLSLDLTGYELPLYELLLHISMIVAACGACIAKTMIQRILALGIVGFGIGLLYIFYSAPDLALTQFAIETLTVVLFSSLLKNLPELRTLSNPIRRARDLFISVSIGCVITAFLISISKYKELHPLSDFFAAASYLQAHGKNVVNVIIVDFRAFDTLGEIVVLAIAAMAVFALLKNKPGKTS